MLKFDRQRAFSVYTIWVYPLILVSILFVTGFDSIVAIAKQTEPLQSGWTLEFVIKTLQQEGVQFALPVFAVLPFSSAFVDEWKSGMIKNIAGRIEKQEYLCSKATAVACAGGVTLALGALFFFGLSFFLFGRLEMGILEQETVKENLVCCIQLLFRYFLNGSLWAEVGLLVSSKLDSRLMAWLSPFMIYYLLIIFYERYFSWVHILYPREWIAAKQQWPLEQWSLCLWLLLLVYVTGCIFYRIGERILQNV
ncbi:MAG: hypothetical protein NC347_03710 [Clostridium sp.]|nr:hypothetical protein [Clostridium sp.]